MENIETYVVEENGQVAINFDALELKTSEKFVKQVKEILSDLSPVVDNVHVNISEKITYTSAQVAIWTNRGIGIFVQFYKSELTEKVEVKTGVYGV